MGVGQQAEGQFGLDPDGVQAGRVVDHQPFFEERVRIIDDGMAPGRDGDAAVLVDRGGYLRRFGVVQAAARGLVARQPFAWLGEATNDVYLNDTAFWGNVPDAVWDYTIGGYQVMKKWLSYRQRDLLGRALSLDEVREVTDMARRIAAILLLGPRLDAHYRALRGGTHPLPPAGA